MSVDAVISSQVIEHLPDDRVLAPEIARLLHLGGWFYVASIIRGPHAFWLYKGKPPAQTRLLKWCRVTLRGTAN